MKNFFVIRIITSIIFICCLLVYSVFNFLNAYQPLKQAVAVSKPAPTKQFVDSVNAVVNENVLGKYEMIDGYGYLQKIMDKNEESNFEIVKDTDGNLHYTYFAKGPNPVNDLANRVQRLKGDIKSSKTRLAVLMPPDKYIRGYTKFPKGIPYNYANETADHFLTAVQKRNIDTFDFRRNLLKSNIPVDDLFYKTDHHWKIETSFWAFKDLVSFMNSKYKTNLDPNHYYTNLKNYNQITYKHSYLGSLGTKAGPFYAGVDDFTLIYPKFKTDYTFHSENSLFNTNTKGRFEEALISSHPFNATGGNKALYNLESNQYFSYLYGNQGLVHVVNKQNPKGPKILFIKDSLTVPVAAFLSTVCSEIYLVDPRYYHDNIPDLINKHHNLDFVFVSVYPQNLIKDFFPF